MLSQNLMLNYLIGTAADLQEFSVREFKIVIVFIYIYIYIYIWTSEDKLERQTQKNPRGSLLYFAGVLGVDENQLAPWLFFKRTCGVFPCRKFLSLDQTQLIK
jgi:hypothetical protein